MELHYYKNEAEDKKYVTWEFNDDQMSYNYGWNKKVGPSYLDTSQEAIEWYIISNEEDLIFVLKEMSACLKSCNKVVDEIKIANKYNKNLGYICKN